VVQAFEHALSDWPPDRAAPVLHAIAGLVHLGAPRLAVIDWVTGDGIDRDGGTAA
jgi:hypothetical protein